MRLCRNKCNMNNDNGIDIDAGGLVKSSHEFDHNLSEAKENHQPCRWLMQRPYQHLSLRSPHNSKACQTIELGKGVAWEKSHKRKGLIVSTVPFSSLPDTAYTSTSSTSVSSHSPDSSAQYHHRHQPRRHNAAFLSVARSKAEQSASRCLP